MVNVGRTCDSPVESPRLKILLVSHHHESSTQIGAVRVRLFEQHLRNLGHDARTIWGSLAPERSHAGAHARTYPRRPRSRRLRRLGGWVIDAAAWPDRQIVHVRRMANIDQFGNWRPDIIVASGPPFSVFFLARHLARRWNVNWVADYRDLWTSSSYYPFGAIRRRLERRLERRLLRSASLAITVSAPLARDLDREIGVSAQVVLNGYDDTVALGPAPPPAVGLPLRLVYAGEIYPGRRDPTPLFDAIEELGLGPDQIRVDFYGATTHLLESSLAQRCLDQVVGLHARVSHHDAIDLQRAADVLLLLLWNHPGEAGVFSGKIFEYLYLRRPILMLGYSEGVAADLVRSRAAGTVANTSRDIAAALTHWVDIKREAGTVPSLAPTVAAGLSRRDSTNALVAAVRGVLDAN